jgi:hypothetical protein
MQHVSNTTTLESQALSQADRKPPATRTFLAEEGG